jgi:hypothetical protein
MFLDFVLCHIIFITIVSIVHSVNQYPFCFCFGTKPIMLILFILCKALIDYLTFCKIHNTHNSLYTLNCTLPHYYTHYKTLNTYNSLYTLNCMQSYYHIHSKTPNAHNSNTHFTQYFKLSGIICINPSRRIMCYSLYTFCKNLKPLLIEITACLLSFANE